MQGAQGGSVSDDRETSEVSELLAFIRDLAASRGLPTLLTLKAAARELSVSETTLKGLVRNGDLQVVRIGARRMVPASEIRRLAIPPKRQEKKRGAFRPRTHLQEVEALRERLRRDRKKR